jgi:glycerol-3-phosphate dehydrogenase (NAD(P)+)
MILGAGLMGTAFSFPLADRGYHVNLVGTHLDTDIIEEIHQNGVHPKLHSQVPDGVTPYPIAGLSEAISGVDLVVLGVNSLGVGWAAEMLGQVLPPGIPVLMLTKGLSGGQDRLSILPDVLRSGLPTALRGGLSIVAVGGPSIAGELASRRHTCVVFAGSDEALLEKLRRLVQTPYYHVWTSTDLVGVETCVALKNAYALAVGLVHGWLERDGVAPNGSVMHNVAAAIFAQGLYEIAYLVQHLGGQLSSVYSLPGAGDLYVTSMGGRNGRMGRLLALGWNYQDAKAKYMPDETVEGAELLVEIGPALEALVENGELDGARLPLLLTMAQVVCKQAPLDIPWERFFQGATEPIL